MKGILHIAGGLNVGGVEAWLERMVRVPLPGFQHTIVVFEEQPYDLEENVNASGTSVVRWSRPRLSLLWLLRTVFWMKRGKYCAIHCHINFASAAFVLAAWFAGVSVRIAHAHTAAEYETCSLRNRVYLCVSRCILNLLSSRKLAVSTEAGRNIFGCSFSRSERFTIAPPGIDVIKFSGVRSRRAGRDWKGGPLTIVHIGRLVPIKNHRHLLLLAEFLKARGINFRMRFAGDGPLREKLRQEIEERDLSDCVRLEGLKLDVTNILETAHVLCMPSLNEGLPVVLIEAQAAGVPIVMSDTISQEVIEVPELVFSLSLGQGVMPWANAVIEAGKRPLRIGLSNLDGTRLDIKVSRKLLASVYEFEYYDESIGSYRIL